MPVTLEALLTTMGKGCRLTGRAESPKLDLKEGSVERFVDIKPFRVEKKKVIGYNMMTRIPAPQETEAGRPQCQGLPINLARPYLKMKSKEKSQGVAQR